MTDYYLIYDQGGQSTRALVFDEAGNTVAEARAPIATHRADAGVVEQDIAALLASIDMVSAVISKTLADDLSLVRAAGLVTQRSSLVCWNHKTGVALTPVISWQDVRAKDIPQLINLDASLVTQLTGLRPSPHYAASKIRWCLDNVSQVTAAKANGELTCGPLASFLLFHLTGGSAIAVDPANGSRTLLWNWRSNQWDDQMLRQFGIPGEVLPTLRPISSHFGELNLVGYKIPINLLNGDQCAAFYGRGELESGVVAVNAGTGAFIATPWDESRPAPEGLLKTLVYDDGRARTFVAEGTVNGAASALKWAAGKLDNDTLAMLDQWCCEVKNPPLFMNGVGGLAAPFWRPDFESEFIGEGDTPDKMVAVLESIVFLLMENLARLRQKEVLLKIVVGGGLAESVAFCQSLATLSELPVFHPNETELTARGAAFLLAGKPAGWGQSEGQKYLPVANAGLKDRYVRWQRAMKARLSQ